MMVVGVVVRMVKVIEVTAIMVIIAIMVMLSMLVEMNHQMLVVYYVMIKEPLEMLML